MSFWNDRYAADTFAYGDRPNDFLAAHAARIPKGQVLCLAEGEGRNAVYLATLGYDVLAVDQSAVGLAKAHALAARHGVTLRTQVADLATYRIAPGRWQGIVSIWCHVPPAIRVPLHAQVVAGLAPGGVFVLEAYAPDQLTSPGVGGPPQVDLLMSVPDLRHELDGLHFERLAQTLREVEEGAFHSGTSSVVQVLAVAPDRPTST